LNNRFLVAASFILVMVVAFSSTIVIVKAQIENTSIGTANSSINEAFSSVLAAEKAGGNVTQLLSELNSAGDFLANAENQYRTGDLTNATSQANMATSIAIEVNREALALKSSAAVESARSFWLTIIFSGVGAFILLFASFIAWRLFKRSYMKKVLFSKPEVVENRY